MAPEPASVPDWRDAAHYADLYRAGRAAWAWEWLRRDPGYCAAAGGKRWPERTGALGILMAEPAAAPWGLHAFENPALAAADARPVWRHGWYRRVLAAGAEPADSAGDLFDLVRFAGIATLVCAAGGREHLLLAEGLASLRLDIVSGSLLAGPVRLTYRLAGFAALHGPLDALDALLRLWRSGHLAPPLPRDRNRRLVLLLRAFDALQAGAGQREIAAVLLSREASRGRWRTEAPHLRSRAQRLAKGARAMAGGGYRALLAG